GGERPRRETTRRPAGVALPGLSIVRRSYPLMRRKKLRVAIIGVGNCASSLVQGVEFYRNAREGDSVPGLMHVNLGGYHIGDIEFTAAFDVNAAKVGKDLAEAVFAPPNNTY